MKNKLIKKMRHSFSKGRLGDFICNFVAVVLGIVITFIGSDLITEHNTQEELKQAMQLVKSELAINKEEIKNIQEQLLLEQQCCHFLLKHKGKMEEAPRDSLNQYAYMPFQIRSFSFVSDAVEMLKSSGFMPKIKNKELCLQIIKAYVGIKSADARVQNFNKAKTNLQERISGNPQINRYLSTRDHSPADVWNFLFQYSEATNLIQQIPEIDPNPIQPYIDIIEQTITAIDKEYK